MEINQKQSIKFKREKQNKKDDKNMSPKFWSILLVKLQDLGKSLMYPIALLPFAALLNRFGSLAMELNADSQYNAGWWIGFVLQKPGGTIFDQLPLVFAIGTAFGLSKDQRGESALVGAAFYLILVAFLSEGGLPKLFYDKVLTFNYFDPETGEVAGSLSSLFYVPNFGMVKIGDEQTLKEVGGTYILNIGVLGGITAGCLSAWSYNKCKDIKLPQTLSFFGGRRFVPMVVMVVSIPVAFLFAIIWPWLQYGLVSFGKLVSSGDAWAIPGAFLYGFINRMVQPTGLHHIINTFLWFQMPIDGYVVDFTGKITLFADSVNNWANLKDQAVIDAANAISSSLGMGQTITETNIADYFVLRQMPLDPKGDPIFISQLVNGAIKYTIFGDITAFQKSIVSGNFQTGYFPMFWGGLPGAALAMIFCAKKERRKEVSTFLGGVALVAALTGIDEPLVFAFIFVGPILLVINALFTSVFAAIAVAMHMHIGFGFSGGFIDYVISFANSWGMSKYEGVVNGSVYGILSNPLWMFALAGLAFPTYFFTFTFLIKKMNIKTPGREDEGEKISVVQKEKGKNTSKSERYKNMAQGILEIVGNGNIVKIENCATRLRLTVKDNKTNIDDGKFKALGAYGVKRLGEYGLQIIIGTDVEHVANELIKITNIN